MIELFGALGIVFVMCGGLLAAFSVRKPTPLKTWMSAYLVLVAGLTQFGLAVGWQQLQGHYDFEAILAFAIFNIGNGWVLVGTALKHRSRPSYSLVQFGGFLLAASMAILAWTVRTSEPSWTLAWFVALVLIIVVTMPIGLTISSRKHTS